MGLKEVVAAVFLTLSQQTLAAERYLEYYFKASLLKVPLVTGNFYYKDGYKEIEGEIIPSGGLIQELSGLFKHRHYRTIIYKDSIVYFERENSTKNNKKIFDINSPHFDALTCVKKLLDYIERDSLEYHQLVKEGALTLFVENKTLSVKLKTLEDSVVIKHKGKKIKTKKLSIYGCPDNQTHIDLFIHDCEVIEIKGRFDKFFGIKFNAELKNSFEKSRDR
ncbi:MAG: hypothetical protein N3G19_03005 [Candidatus Pacearchaeota archaeon]|nr:hypothetical protein [Candidatus Pacearchaeota archaeon]